MEFNQDNYAAIKTACEEKKEIEFTIPKPETAFASSQAPDSWTAYPPAALPPEGYAQVFVQSGTDRRGALTKLELLVHLDGGRILYKNAGNDTVSLKVTWPKKCV